MAKDGLFAIIKQKMMSAGQWGLGEEQGLGSSKGLYQLNKINIILLYIFGETHLFRLRKIRCLIAGTIGFANTPGFFFGGTGAHQSAILTISCRTSTHLSNSFKGFVLLLLCALIYLAIINIIAFIMYGADKHKAKTKKWRTPEKLLIGIAAIGGSIGALLGMQIFRHKTQHPQFKYGIPAIFFIQIIVTIGLIYHFCK